MRTAPNVEVGGCETMFKVFRHQPNAVPLLQSRLCNEKAFYKFFIEDLLQAQRSIIIESPFITPRQVSSLEDVFRQLVRKDIQITIHTRAPHQHDHVMAIKAQEGIRTLYAMGVQVVVCDSLMHWKLAFIDNAILWEGSLNILSHGYSKEIMRRTVSPALCQQMRGFIETNRGLD